MFGTDVDVAVVVAVHDEYDLGLEGEDILVESVEALIGAFAADADVSDLKIGDLLLQHLLKVPGEGSLVGDSLSNSAGDGVAE